MQFFFAARMKGSRLAILITILKNGTIVTPETIYEGNPLVIRDGKIHSVGVPEGKSLPLADHEIDATNMWITPGLIDIHTHGAAGHDTMDATREALEGFSSFLARHGVTRFLPTTITASGPAIQAAIDNITQAAPHLAGAKCMGIHLEGPYLNPAFKGAQPESLLRPVDKAEYQPWIQNELVKLITVAPEIAGVPELIEAGRKHGTEFAVGHSGASYEVMQAAADQGLRQATHTFNGMLGIHHREPGTAGSVLTEDRIYAQIIADGVHLHPAIIKLVVRAKTPNRTILISDSMRATGMGDGVFDLAGQIVQVEGSIARIPSGSLAGSTLTLERAIVNAMAFTSLGFPQILSMATAVPSTAMGWEDQIGFLKPGARADVVCFDSDLVPRMVFVDGNLVHQNL